MKVKALKSAYDELKKDFEALKIAYEEVTKKMSEECVGSDKKSLNKLRLDINKLKEDYKQCMEAVMKETHERNKAETLAKVLKETMEAQNVIKETVMDVDEVIDDKIDDTDWIPVKKVSKKNSKVTDKKEYNNCNVTTYLKPLSKR